MKSDIGLTDDQQRVYNLLSTARPMEVGELLEGVDFSRSKLTKILQHLVSLGVVEISGVARGDEVSSIGVDGAAERQGCAGSGCLTIAARYLRSPSCSSNGSRYARLQPSKPSRMPASEIFSRSLPRAISPSSILK